MSSTQNSGLGHGTVGAPQGHVEEQTYPAKAAENEAKIEQNPPKAYDLLTLKESSPLKIPSTAYIAEQQKQGYQQVKYEWSRGDYRYTSRWHQRTPGAPLAQGNSWVVERYRPGIGHGPNARPAKREVFIKGPNGKGHWVLLGRWRDAIRAQKQGNATKEQKEMLDNGHWPAP